MAATSESEIQHYIGTESVENTLLEYKGAIASWVASVATGVTAEQVGSVLQASASKECDWTLPVPALNKFAKQAGQPAALASSWAAAFTAEATGGLIRSAVAGGVFIHFHQAPELLRERVLKGVFADKDSYGRSNVGQGQTVVVEYSSPNMAKPFHAGHLRSTIIGNFLRNVYERLGYKTVSMNYLGDWGKQYGMLAVGFDKFGDEEQLKADPIRHLYDVYVQVNSVAKAEGGEAIHAAAREHFRKMEEGDPGALAVWQRFRDLSIEKSKHIYSRMGVFFDVYSGESFYPVSKQSAVIARLESLNLLESDATGARLIDLTKWNLGKVVFQKPDGSLLYISRDIAAALERFSAYQFSKMVYVVAAQQQLHFQQLFKILDLMGFEAVKNCIHISFGMVKGMSTRSGTAVFLEDILDTARDTNLEIMKKNDVKFSEVEDPVATADVIGVSAVIIQDLVAKRIKDYAFNWSRCLQTTGDTGAYLQFAHVRIASIMRKANIPVEVDGVDLSLLSEPDCATLISWIADFPGILKRAAELYEPSIVVQYALKLTHLISTMLQTMHVKNAPTPEIGKARMLMFWAAKQTLENALRILSLTPLQRM